MSTFIFGAGDFYAVPLVDGSGNAILTPTPVKIAAVQEIGLDFSGDLKELYGQNQFALAVARGKVKVSGKVKGAQINGAALNSLFFGQAIAAGAMGAVYTDLTGQAIPAIPFQLISIPPNAGAWLADLGVIDANGVPMIRVAATPATGQYSVAAGTYTFAAADTGKLVFVNYSYSSTSATAQKISVKNIAMGSAPSFKAYMQTTYQGKKALVVLYSAVSSKLNMFATKLDDFSIPEFDFSGQSDAANNVADIYISE
jgi:hypothetical protein